LTVASEATQLNVRGSIAMMTEDADRLYLLTGRIASDFSFIEQRWYLIFTCLLHQLPRPAIDAIFSQARSGYQQRALILAVAGSIFAAGDPLLTSVIDLAARTSKAAERRNAAIHSVIHVANYAIPPRIAAGGISKRSPLADKDIAKELADLYRTISDLVLDVEELRLSAIRWSGSANVAREIQSLASARIELANDLQNDPILKIIEGR
jgi:hypothetical protein